MAGDPRLDRRIDLELTGLPPGRFRIRHRRLDEDHSNLNRSWERVRDARDWPDEAGWASLREADRLEEFEPERDEAVDGALRLAFDLPMPAVSLVEVVP